MLMNRNRRRTTLILSIMLITNCFVIGISSAEGGNSKSAGETLNTEPVIVDTITTTVQIDAGDYFYLYYDPEDLELSEFHELRKYVESKEIEELI